jgi:hypothetical protein
MIAAMKAPNRIVIVAAALLCSVLLAACGGDGGDDVDVDAFTGCIEDAGLEVESSELEKSDQEQGLKAGLTISGSDAGPVLAAVFESAEDADAYEIPELFQGVEKVDSIIVFSVEENSDSADQVVSCAEDATG